MSLQSILQELAQEVSKISYQGADKIVVRVSIPQRARESLNKVFSPIEKTGIKDVNIDSIHYDCGIVKIETL